MHRELSLAQGPYRGAAGRRYLGGPPIVANTTDTALTRVFLVWCFESSSDRGPYQLLDGALSPDMRRTVCPVTCRR
jgi:hypothetical protein